LFFEGENWNEIEKKANTGLSIVNEWFSNNSLMSNKSKSVFIPFCMSKTNKPDCISIKLYTSKCNERHKTICLSNCIDINRASVAKYLGVVFDEHIKWTKHISTIIMRLRKCFFIFKELEKYSGNK